MNHYDFHKTFRSFYDKAVAQYAAGKREADALFTPEERAELAANGLTSQYLYDYAEDQANYGEPGYDLALGIEFVRHNYFAIVQRGHPSGNLLDEATLPAKTDAIRGIEWLPRLIPKAKAKLRGELPPYLMYACGGDRKFFKARDINPAEFLTVVWLHEYNDAAIVDWVSHRISSRHT